MTPFVGTRCQPRFAVVVEQLEKWQKLKRGFCTNKAAVMKRIGTQVMWMPTLTLGCRVLVQRCRRICWRGVPDFVVMVCTILWKLEIISSIQA